MNDGYLFNRTTSYTNWDAEMFHGCQCDLGYKGADCSERVCDAGIDLRRKTSGTSNSHEVVTLVCDCRFGTCSNKFKLQFKGQATKNWLYPSSRAYEVANSLMTVPSIAKNISLYSAVSVVAYNQSANDVVCLAGSKQRTRIKFRRNGGDLPAVSFYANLVGTSLLYFETRQTLVCDCTNNACNGTFRVSFDGEMSSRLLTWHNGSSVVSSLLKMQTIIAAAVQSITMPKDTAICRIGMLTNHTFVFDAQMGNLPRLGLLSSVVGYHNPNVYSSVNTSNILTLITNDGRDDNIKECNGVGTCDPTTGTCTCAFGWGPDPDLGPCGRVIANSSDYSGIGRCPGLISNTGNDVNGDKLDLSLKQNHLTRVYLSLNPNVYENDGNKTVARIQYQDWEINPTPHETNYMGTVLFNLTSNVSAGPIVFDQARERIFFYDANPIAPFIGVAQTNGTINASDPYQVWIVVPRPVFGFALDARVQRRKLYWTSPGHVLVRDGNIYWANIDDVYPRVHSLVEVIGRPGLIDPMGIAIHFEKSKIFWLDKDLSTPQAPRGVLRSCNLDGSQFGQNFLYLSVGNQSVSANLTDLVIDFYHNNTAIFIDAGSSPALLATNLDRPRYYNASTDPYIFDLVTGEMTSHVIISRWQTPMVSPMYLATDDFNNFVMWSDTKIKRVKFDRIDQRDQVGDLALVEYTVWQEPSSQNAWTSKNQNKFGSGNSLYTHYPVGIAIDRGLGTPTFNNYLECYGNGNCLGFLGNYECVCFPGYFGDCKLHTCPKGPAWFHEPIVNNVAHDVLMECSNMGQCDRNTGMCVCRDGFEGSACERLSCQGETSHFHECNGRGRCLSMRELALKHKDSHLKTTPLVYGSKPQNPQTWDADMLFSCKDEDYGYAIGTTNNITSYVGPVLDEKECPYGYNSRDNEISSHNTSITSSYKYALEIQQVLCVASSGYFSLAFRGAVSSPISANSTALGLENILETMPTIGKVIVALSNSSTSNTICSTSKNSGGAYIAYTTITFVTELSNTPLLTVASNHLSGGLASATVARLRPGQGTLKECAGNGNCNKFSGMCECFPGYGSSDGRGNLGTRADCGHQKQV